LVWGRRHSPPMASNAGSMTSAGGAAVNNTAGNMMTFSVSNNMTNATD
jgi:hypothetical protein